MALVCPPPTAEVVVVVVVGRLLHPLSPVRLHAADEPSVALRFLLRFIFVYRRPRRSQWFAACPTEEAARTRLLTGGDFVQNCCVPISSYAAVWCEATPDREQPTRREERGPRYPPPVAAGDGNNAAAGTYQYNT